MSENISAAIAVNGEIVMKQPLIKSMRVVKKETLKLISDWVSRTNDHQMVSLLAHKLFFIFSKTLLNYLFILILIYVCTKHTYGDFFDRYWKTLYRRYWTLFYWIIKRRMFIALESPKCLVLWPP